MKVLIDSVNIFYAENVRLVKTLMKRESPEEHPELMKWALQMLYFDGDDWIEICRFDNYLHENQAGSHIHLFNGSINRVDMTFREAEIAIKERSKRTLKEKFNVEFEDGN